MPTAPPETLPRPAEQTGPPSRPAVELKAVVRRFGRGRRARAALDGLDLTVPAGAVFGLAGDNGSGKTTTLLAVLGLLPVHAGRVRVGGLDPVRHGDTVRRRTALVPEHDRPQKWLATRTWLAMAADAFADWDPGRASQWARRYELDPDKPVEAMSKGQLGRIKLVIALARRPALVVLDEPWDGLDPGSREALIEGVQALHAGGATVLVCSHNLAELDRVMTHAGLLVRGRCVWEGEATTLRKRHGLLLAGPGAAPLPAEVRVLGAAPAGPLVGSRRLVADRGQPALRAWLARHPSAELRAPTLPESYALLCGAPAGGEK